MFNTHLLPLLPITRLDNLKQVMQSHGPNAGNLLLSETGNMISGILRKGDLVFRYDEDSFVIIMTDTHLEGAKVVCERIRRMTQSHRFEYQSKTINLTISAGISAYNHSIKQTPFAFLETAERALKEAQRKGGNRVEIMRFLPMDISLAIE